VGVAAVVAKAVVAAGAATIVTFVSRQGIRTTKRLTRAWAANAIMPTTMVKSTQKIREERTAETLRAAVAVAAGLVGKVSAMREVAVPVSLS
jgi:hypothetical protein